MAMLRSAGLALRRSLLEAGLRRAADGPSPRRLLHGGVVGLGLLARRAPPPAVVAASRLFSASVSGSGKTAPEDTAAAIENGAWELEKVVNEKKEELFQLAMQINSSSTLADHKRLESKREEILNLLSLQRQAANKRSDGNNAPPPWLELVEGDGINPYVLAVAVVAPLLGILIAQLLVR